MNPWANLLSAQGITVQREPEYLNESAHAAAGITCTPNSVLSPAITEIAKISLSISPSQDQRKGKKDTKAVEIGLKWHLRAVFLVGADDDAYRLRTCLIQGSGRSRRILTQPRRTESRCFISSVRSPNFERSIGRERPKIDPIATRTRRGKASPKLSEADRLLAGNMMEAGDLTMKEVADRLGVKTPALYQHIPPPNRPRPKDSVRKNRVNLVSDETGGRQHEGNRRTGILSEDATELLRGHGWRSARAVLHEAVLRLWDDEAISLAGNIAFRAVLAMFPFLIFISSLTAFIGDQGMANRLIEFLIAIVPASLVDTLVSEVRAVVTERRGGLAGIGIFLTIWFAVGGVDSVRVGLNRAYDVKESRSALRIYVLQVLVVVGAGLVFVIVAFLLLLAPLLGSLALRLLPWFQPTFSAFEMVRYPSAAAILMIALFAAHIVLPARRTRFSNIWPGVLLTVLVWLSLAIIFSWYLARFADYASYYAGIAGVIAALYFIYLAALVLIFGGEINRSIRIRRLARAMRRAAIEIRRNSDVGPDPRE